ncbi:MAG: hypothetical protein Q9220_005240 [cf. Caloplaca sp. 1 TL-2023]
MGSLKSDSIEKLADEGILTGPGDPSSTVAPKESEPDKPEVPRERGISGRPWFEEMIEGSELGRIKRRRGGHSSADGQSKVAWEVVEFSTEPPDTGASTGKRKLDQANNDGENFQQVEEHVEEHEEGSATRRIFAAVAEQRAFPNRKECEVPLYVAHNGLLKENEYFFEYLEQGLDSNIFRVGLRRMGGDGAPRSKKEGSKDRQNAVTFPDKPLPSPPIAHVKTTSTEEARSLIDASEKVLLRSSSQSPRQEEEWPVLFPQKPTPPDGIREMLGQGSLQQPGRQTAHDQERYPSLKGSQPTKLNVGPETSAGLFSAHMIPERDPFTFDIPTEAHMDSGIKATGGGADQAMAKTSSDPIEVKAIHRLSAGAAAVEKSTSGPKSIKEPRQTRTSSLRARISAGQLMRDSPTKVLGFTDFTTEKAPLLKASKEDMGSAANGLERPSSSFSKNFKKKPSREFLGTSRVPAQFVAGSRRSIGRRPSSRNSLRNGSGSSSPTSFEPSRPAPPVPNAKVDTSIRKSSIPKLRHGSSAGMPKSNHRDSSARLSTGLRKMKSDEIVKNGFKVWEDKASMGAADSGASTTTTDQSAVLDSIIESPKSTFRSRRISTTSPSFGPTLKISSSADRVIMGAGTKVANKENPSVVEKSGGDLLRTAITNDHRNAVNGRPSSAGSKETLSRPLSSLGFPENRKHSDTTTASPRSKKVKSVDLSVVASEDALHADKKGSDYVSMGAKGSSSDTQLGSNGNRQSLGEQHQLKEKSLASHGAELQASGHHVKNNVTSIGDDVPLVAAYLPETIKAYVKKATSDAEPAASGKVKDGKITTESIKVNGSVRQGAHHDNPSTPRQESEADQKISSDPFPPRSSSRLKHPAYNIDGSIESSPRSPFDKAAIALQKEISTSQLPVSKAPDLEGNFRPLKKGVATTQPEMSSQTTLADMTAKRDSAAQESNKSHVSVSKGLMSNFRGLFHKRTTSDVLNSPTPRTAKKNHRRPTVNAHGSPFPSMSDIHPIHRPTQASINRSTAARNGIYGSTTTILDTPSIVSPIPSEVSTTTSLAMQILESARKESSSPKKERLLALGRIMVDTITQARDAEKAMEEAKQAARKAEVAHALCKKSVSDVASIVREWRGDVGRM